MSAMNEELIGRADVNDLEAILAVTNTDVSVAIHTVEDNAAEPISRTVPWLVIAPETLSVPAATSSVAPVAMVKPVLPLCVADEAADWPNWRRVQRQARAAVLKTQGLCGRAN